MAPGGFCTTGSCASRNSIQAAYLHSEEVGEMVSQSDAIDTDAQTTEPASFESFAGTSAIVAGALVFIYAIGFVILTGNISVLVYSLAQLLGGLFTTAALLGLYYRLRTVDRPFALWGTILALFAAIGSLIHGGYDLANAINPPTTSTDLPSQIDPRGLLTFGVAGVGLFVLSWLMSRTNSFPKNLALLGYVLALLLVITYLARLIILDPKNLVVAIPALLTGFIVNPVWYIWLGTVLRRGRSST
jgi:hypothetical protein